jgi:hypothetical protein
MQLSLQRHAEPNITLRSSLFGRSHGKARGIRGQRRLVGIVPSGEGTIKHNVLERRSNLELHLLPFNCCFQPRMRALLASASASGTMPFF